MKSGSFHFGGLSVLAQQGIRLACVERDLGELVGAYVSLEQAAWLYFRLRALEDRAEWFPHGKWATIQEIERLLDLEASGE